MNSYLIRVIWKLQRKYEEKGAHKESKHSKLNTSSYERKKIECILKRKNEIERTILKEVVSKRQKEEKEERYESDGKIGKESLEKFQR